MSKNKFRSPFEDAIEDDLGVSPTDKGDTQEPNLPEGMPKGTGGFAPMKLRDPITPKKPGWVEPGKSFMWGASPKKSWNGSK